MERQLLLLGLLRQQDMHGYQLNEFIETNLAFCADIKKSTAYYLLDKLAEEGHIEEVETPTETNRPPRKTYRITPQGEQRFLHLLRQTLQSYTPPTFAIDMGIAFMDALPAEEIITLLEKRQALIRQQFDALHDIEGHTGILDFITQHHILHLEAELKWLEHVIRQT